MAVIRRPWNTRERATAIAMRAEGADRWAIAHALGRSPSSVHMYLSRLRGEGRSIPVLPCGRKPNSFDMAQAVALRAQGLTYNEIGRLLDVSHMTVLRRLSKELGGVCSQGVADVARDVPELPPLTNSAAAPHGAAASFSGRG